MESYYTVNSAARNTVIAANATGEFDLNGNKVLDKKCAAKNNVALLPAIVDEYDQDVIIIGSKSITIGALVARKFSSTRRQQHPARRIRPCRKCAPIPTCIYIYIYIYICVCMRTRARDSERSLSIWRAAAGCCSRTPVPSLYLYLDSFAVK